MSKVTKKDSGGGAEIAAIAVAIHLFRSDARDIENAILTIKPVRDYSPWSSKIYVTHNNMLLRK